MYTRILPFGFVGALAGAVHYCAALAIVAEFGLSPQIGNVGGYIIALFVSYYGQSRWTFQHAERRLANFLRFICTSLAGFALNFLLYAALLRWTAIDYRIALLLVIGSVAALTYALLKIWVFKVQASS